MSTHLSLAGTRVFVTGAEWSAELVGAPPASGQDVLVERVSGSCLTVRAD